MANPDRSKGLSGEWFDDDVELDLAQLCLACRLSEEGVRQLVEEGVIEPLGREPTRWRFRAVSIRRVQRAHRLQRDLGVNVAGAALALDLLEELEKLRKRLRQLEAGIAISGAVRRD